ncbi:ATP-grasp domain-containing protein, partial [Pseudomassariella vexata]
VFQVAKSHGYVIHADPWSFQVANSPLVVRTQSFLQPHGEAMTFAGVPEDAQGLASALDASLGAVQSRLPFCKDTVRQLEIDLRRRLSFGWLSPAPVPSRRVCIVLEGEISIRATKFRWETAAALGVDVVVLSTGSWWQDDQGPFGSLREAFIITDLTPGPDLGARIARALKSYPHTIDGIFALSDTLLIPVAEAATQLGLWTSGPEPYRISTNKFLTRQLLDPTSGEYFSVNSLEELEMRLTCNDPVSFPVVCKPFCGIGSEGVYRADNPTQLRHAVSQCIASKNHESCLIEPYVDGPEVDCNLVFMDGHLLYSEVVDYFPCDADVAEDATDKLFAETEAVVPCQLPVEEQKAIVETVSKAVILQGFDTGVFHCEARVRNSFMTYRLAHEATIPDLVVKDEPRKTEEKIRIFLHEINARIPGIASSASSLIANGIDFWALQILCAVGDWGRYKALSVPFLSSSEGGGHHVWLTNSLVPITYKGIQPLYPNFPMDRLGHQLVDSSHNPVVELSESHEELTRYVLRHNANVNDGVKYGFNKGDWLWTACLVIRSPISRKL